MLKIVVDPFTSAKDLGKGTHASVEFLPGSGVALKESDYISFFTPMLKGGHEVLFLPISFKLLKDKGSAIKAAITELKQQFPDGRIEYLDTQSASAATGIIASLCVTVANAGSMLQDVMEFALTLIGRFAVVFAVDNLEAVKNDTLFKKALKDFPGELVNNKPILCVDNKGELVLLDKRRGFRAAVNALPKIVQANGLNVADYDVIILHGNAKTEAEAVAKTMKELACDNVFVIEIGKALKAKLAGKAVGVAFHMRLKSDDE